MAENPKFSVIIVNYETSEMVRRCVASISGQDVHCDVVVVDNPSPLGDVENLSDLPARIVGNTENIGYGRACNIGAGISKGDYVCILNPDIALPPGSLGRWLSVCEREHSAGRRVGILAPRLVTDNGSVQRSAYAFPSPVNYWLYHSLLAGLLKRLRKSFRLGDVPNPRTVQRVGWVMGAALLVPRAVWDEVGGFSNKYFLYAEDMDLCFRTREAGYEVLYAHEVELIHSLGEGAPETRDVAALRLFTSLRTFLYLRYRPAKRLAVASCVVIDMLLRLMIFAPLALMFPHKVLYRKRVSGYRDVLVLYLGRRRNGNPGAGPVIRP